MAPSLASISDEIKDSVYTQWDSNPGIGHDAAASLMFSTVNERVNALLQSYVSSGQSAEFVQMFFQNMPKVELADISHLLQMRLSLIQSGAEGACLLDIVGDVFVEILYQDMMQVGISRGIFVVDEEGVLDLTARSSEIH
ncbi:hypothetical protein [Neptuniibacter sp. QD37_11]|uniref:hypothetical protein n=1 Tax=Neptuniibacter sp. QD37_11 TaxID=3398209 RepID=UPI0039F4E665